MLSHINLVEAILASRRLDLSRRPGRPPDIQRTGLSFEKILTKSLKRCPSIFPLNNEISAAENILSKSQGSTAVYLRLREQRYARLAEIRPERYGKYLKGLNNRIKYLRTMVTQQTWHKL